MNNHFLKLTVMLMMLSSGNAFAKTLVFCSEANPESFSSAIHTGAQTNDAASRNGYDRLVDFERGTTNLRPSLATSWEASEDGLTYKFSLRKGVKFHKTSFFTPTRDFNADDVIFTFMRQYDPNHPFHKVNGGTYTYFQSMGMDKLIKSIKKQDDYVVVFELNEPEAPFLSNLAMHFASIQSAEYADQLLKEGKPEQIDFKPIGTGPFAFAGYQKDSVIRYLAHKDYWRGKSPLDKLIFSITPDPAVRLARLQAGECHVMAYPNLSDMKTLEEDKNIKVMEKEGLNIGYLAFNTTKKPFDDPRVRQALNYAINKKSIIQAVYQGLGVVAKNPVPPTLWSYNDGVRDYDYNPEMAKKLLAEAGFAKGFETDIWAMPVQRPYNPNGRRVAELIQEDWNKVGVNAEIITYEWGEYLKRSKKGEHQTLLLGWTGDNGDPDNFLHTLLGCDAAKTGNNRAFWCHKPFDDLIIKAKRTADFQERTKFYEESQVVFKDQAPWVTLAHSINITPVRAEVQNFKIHPLGGHYFYGVDLKEK